MKVRTNHLKKKSGSKRRSLPLLSTLTLAALIVSGFSASVRNGQAAASSHPVDAVRVTVNTTGDVAQSPRLAAVGIDPVKTLSGTTIYVTTTAQGIADDGKCSLQEAIYSANLDFGVAPSSFNPIVMFDTGCEPGSGDDTIVLEAGKEYLMTTVLDDPYNPVGPTANPIVLSNVTIEANGARLVRPNPNRDFTGYTNFRAFAVAKRAFADPDNELGVQGTGTGSLTIRNAHIKGFTVKGGDGKSGGGGGMGAGGAIYVRDARLALESCTFENNGAGGGQGSFHYSGPGGGGGMGGDGGYAQGDTTHDSGMSGGGGGGGGARGDGAANGFAIPNPNGAGTLWLVLGGGGGGGTLSGAGGDEDSGMEPGVRCGGAGGEIFEDGDDAHCAGGGGGGGGDADAFSLPLYDPDGDAGNGNYGGGGGGAGVSGHTILSDRNVGTAGRGGFGGGGGGGGRGGEDEDYGPGGDGGFGGGGGSGGGKGGIIGLFGGDGTDYYSGGGAGLGGAIFSHGGTVTVWNSTFTGNYAVRGSAPRVFSGVPGPAENGDDAGGAIFTLNGKLELYNSTISRNETTGDLGGVVVLSAYDQYFIIDPQHPVLPPKPPATLVVHNTIIANNGATSDGIVYSNSTGEVLAGGLEITKTGSHNLIVDNHSTASNAFPGVTVTADPQLDPLANNEPGLTPTMALSSTSPAIDAGINLINEGITTDQRGVPRRSGTYDIGAYEFPSNHPPEAAAPNPAPLTDEDTAVAIGLSATDADDDALTFTITDGPDSGLLSVTAGSAVAGDCTAANTCTLGVQYTPAANFNGTDAFKFKANDGQADSNEVTVSITVNPINDAPTVSATPLTQPDVQYSDPVQSVTITAGDLETPAGSLTVSTSYTRNAGSSLAGLPAGLALTDNGVNGSGNRQWTVSGKADVPAGTYVVTAAVTDRGDPDSAAVSPAITVPVSFTVKVIRENLVVTPSTALSAVKVSAPGGSSPQFTLTAAVVEEPDGSPGDISKASPVTFTLSPVGGGSSPTCTDTNNSGSVAGSELTVSCTFSNVPVGVYEVNIVVGGDYYTGGGSTVLTVYDPSLGFVTGGGWIINPITGYRANFGVNVKYLKNGNAQGQALYIEHRPTGDFKVKSNSMQNVAILTNEAQVTAKATYQGVGNYVVIARAIDNGEPGTNDKFGLKLIDPSGRAVADLTFISSPVLLGGGNNQVPKK